MSVGSMWIVMMVYRVLIDWTVAYRSTIAMKTTYKYLNNHHVNELFFVW